jgi:hypothetical protein
MHFGFLFTQEIKRIDIDVTCQNLTMYFAGRVGEAQIVVWLL